MTIPSRCLFLATLLLSAASGARAQAPAPALAPPAKGERIVILGNGLAERDLYYGRMETELHLRFPDQELYIRNMAKPADTAGFRPHPARASQWAFPGAEKFHRDLSMHNGKGFYPTPDEWLTQEKPDTIIAFYGFNESFAGPKGADNFGAELDAFATYTATQKYNGKAAPRLVLVSPIAFENLTAKRDLPNGKNENASLALYTEAMRKVAAKHGLTFVDLYNPTLKAYGAGKPDFTINGFAPTDYGYRQLGTLVADGVYGPAPHRSKADPELLRKMVLDKDWFWFNDYQALNGVHVYGERFKPYGPANYPDEIQKTRQMLALRQTRLHEIAQGKSKSLVVDDSGTLPLKPVQTNFNKPIEYLDEQKALAAFTMREGFKIALFASEKEFPNLEKPMQMSFDNKGRLWVAVTPTYPHYQPGAERPDDKILIYEDTDGDGKADKETVFADHLQLPIGFEIAPEGVYVSQEPNLCLLIDDNKDDRADRMEIILQGFDTHDTHHAISAYAADAGGAFYLCEGRFLHSQVETPYGPQRCNDGGVWRFDPKRFRLERYSQSDYSNPWGVAFDQWDQCFISDASSGNNWWGLPLSAKVPYGVEIPKVAEFAPKRARPTSGSEFVYSRHFPDDLQGSFLLCNSIGFLGTSIHNVWEDGAGFSGKHIGDLVSSKDPNFRPVDLEFGPDGALYIIDWQNALIGHMQHNARDPNRDHTHGRIYRVTYPARPLVKSPKVAGATIPELLEVLKVPELRTRYRARRELRGRAAAEVLPAVQKWAAALDKKDPNYERYLCEALWVTWSQNKPDAGLLKQCLAAQAPQARAAAVHVLRYSADQIPGSTELFMKAANDPHARVRLEALVAASWLENGDGPKIVLECLRQPLDRWMGPTFDMITRHTFKDEIEALKKSGAPSLSDNPAARDFLAGKLKIAKEGAEDAAKGAGPTRKLNAEETKIYNLGKQVFGRDAHCATCHQADGKGLPKIYPPLTESPWVTGDEERLIKIALKGLWGPIEVNGNKFDPNQGVPPMTGFAGLLNDEEMAAVLSYVRTSFGNNAPFVQPDSVKKVREATKDRVNFYMVDEILKAHPFPAKQP